MQAGVIEEMVGDTMDTMDDEDLLEAADEEVQCLTITHKPDHLLHLVQRLTDSCAWPHLPPPCLPLPTQVEKVLYDITAGEMGKLPEKGGGALVSELPDSVSEEQAEAFIRQMMAT